MPYLALDAQEPERLGRQPSPVAEGCTFDAAHEEHTADRSHAVRRWPRRVHLLGGVELGGERSHRHRRSRPLESLAQPRLVDETSHRVTEREWCARGHHQPMLTDANRAGEGPR